MNKRLYQLDILRFLAAVSVALFHYTHAFHNNHSYYILPYKFLNDCFVYGNSGVQLFFVISGFVILMSVSNQSPRKFVIARIVRLYPAYVPLCIFTFLFGSAFVHGYSVSAKDFLLNVSLVGTFFSDKLVSGVYWTLETEILFYLFIYILLVSKKIHRIRIFLNTWLVLSLITYFAIEYNLFNYFRIFNIIRAVAITQYSYFFIAGCYFYLIKYNRKKYDIFVPIICLTGGILSYTLVGPQNRFIIAIIQLFIFIVFYWLALRKDTETTYSKFYYNLGETTYPLYLLHDIVGMYILFSLAGKIPASILFIGTLLFVIILAFGVHKFIEKPIRNALKSVLK